AVVLLFSSADAFWRMPCHFRTGLGRLDPLMDPGEVSDHSHAIHGGGNFGFTTSYDDLMDSNCTSCGVYEDKSAYWTPSVHFMYTNGTTVIVPQIGGMLAYYLLYGDNIQAFPKNFRLLAGNKNLRNFSGPIPDTPKSLWTASDKTQFSLGQKALGFNCLNYAVQPEPSLYRHFMPSKDYLDANCTDGVRLELMFPSCWNGHDVDSKDHKSHMAYPDLVMTGDCPEGFTTRTPSLFFETIWNTYAFKGEDGQFVLSNGDPTGCGYHGDFMTGWDVDFLQKAVNTCTNLSGEISDCPLFSLQSDDDAQQCTFPMPSQIKNDDCEGPSDGLCGNVPIQSGPAQATNISPGQTVEPTGSAHPEPTHSSESVSYSLGYTIGTSVYTDNSGGGITAAEAPSSYAHATPTADSDVEVASADVPSPVPTPSPDMGDAQDGDPNAVSTSIWTSGGAVHEVYIEEDIVTTTVTAGADTKRRRHVHHHR
ncbi:hypothetical protein NA57DRAFT_24348, partial [Rhizodiscina lignyota]